MAIAITDNDFSMKFLEVFGTRILMSILDQQMENNQMSGQMFDLNQTSPNIATNSARCP